jgi:type I restriction enzyme S subunit
MDGALPSYFTWFTPSDFEHGEVIAESKRKIPQEAVDEGEAKVFPAHSLMVIGIGAPLGKVASSRASFSANQQINVITPLESVRWDYLLYVLQGYEHVFRAHANSATLPFINQERLGVIRVPVPPSAEQDAIVTRLNESRAEYAQVNQLLGNSVSLLKERRAALITAAVAGQIPLEEMTG